MNSYPDPDTPSSVASEPAMAYGKSHVVPEIGTRMMISPYLTHKSDWVAGNLMEIEHNRYRGLVYVVKTDAGEIFFSVAEDFKY